MSLNLNYEDLWNDLYEWCLGHAKDVAAIMEEMDPRLQDENGCEVCYGTGVIINAEPSCKLPPLGSGETVIEKCDNCEKFSNDIDAALSVAQEIKIIKCEERGLHVVIPQRKDRFTPEQ